MSLPCPRQECGSADTSVIDSRMKIDGEGIPYVWRRRKCQKCGERFTAVENRQADLETNEPST